MLTIIEFTVLCKVKSLDIRLPANKIASINKLFFNIFKTCLILIFLVLRRNLLKMCDLFHFLFVFLLVKKIFI